MLACVKHMLVKEFIQVFRDPRMRGLIFVAPVIQLLVLGYAVSTDVKDVPLAVVDRDGTPASRALADRFDATATFEIASVVRDGGRASAALDREEVDAFLSIGPGFEDRLLSGRPAPLQLVVDGTDSMTASVVLSHGAAVVESFASARTAERAMRLTGRKPESGVELELRAWFNENLESRNFYIPGVFGLLVTLMTLLLTGMAVVREKEIGTLEQILVTPIRPWEFILGKTLPFALIGFADVLIVLVVGTLWFGVPLRGSVPLLFLSMGLFVMTTLGVGLFISTISGTQQQALMTTFFFFMPAMLLSGFAFPIETMPEAVRALTLLNPLRYLFVILRGIFLKGTGVDVLWPQLLALAVLGVATLALASLRFKKTLK